MASPIQRLAKLSYKIFGTHSNEVIAKENLYPLMLALNEIKATDIRFDPEEIRERDKTLKNCGQVAPVTFMNVHESNCFTMTVFVLKSGSILPLHDHPRMFGLLKVISGSVKITSYSQIDSQPLPHGHGLNVPHLNNVLTVKRNNDTVVTENDDCCFLSPVEGNFHEIEPVTDIAAFLDILAPPYGMDHDCNYYKELPAQSPHHKDVRWLAEVSQPRTYWCDVLKYKGPSLSNCFEDSR